HVSISRQESRASRVQHKASRADDSSGASGCPVRVSGGNLQAMGKPCAGHSWRGRPRSRAVRIVEKPSVEKAGRGSKEEQFKMDEVGRAMQPALQLAGR